MVWVDGVLEDCVDADWLEPVWELCELMLLLELEVDCVDAVLAVDRDVVDSVDRLDVDMAAVELLVLLVDNDDASDTSS